MIRPGAGVVASAILGRRRRRIPLFLPSPGKSGVVCRPGRTFARKPQPGLKRVWVSTTSIVLSHSGFVSRVRPWPASGRAFPDRRRHSHTLLSKIARGGTPPAYADDWWPARRAAPAEIVSGLMTFSFSFLAALPWRSRSRVRTRMVAVHPHPVIRSRLDDGFRAMTKPKTSRRVIACTDRADRRTAAARPFAELGAGIDGRTEMFVSRRCEVRDGQLLCRLHGIARNGCSRRDQVADHEVAAGFASLTRT